MLGPDLFVMDTLQANGSGMLTYMPYEYGKIELKDDSDIPIRIRPFIYDILRQRIHDSTKQTTLDCNQRRLVAVEQMVDDLQRTGIFKSCLVRFRKRYRDTDLLLTMKRKSAYFFSVQQTFNTEGNIIVSYSGGLRNIAGMLDVLNFNYEKSLQKDKLAQANLNWAFPFWYGNTNFDLGYYQGSSSLDGKVVEKKQSVSFKFSVPIRNISVKYSAEDRQNVFDPDDISLDVLNHEMLPSFIHKYEFAGNLFTNLAGKTDAKLIQSFGENSSTMFELDNKFKLSLSKLFSENVPSKVKELSIENLFNAKCIFHEKGRLRINDRIHFNQLRGFSRVGQRSPAFNKDRHPRHNSPGFMHLGDHLGSRLGVRNTTKLIFESYPYLKDNANLKAFFHLTSIVTSERKFGIDLKDGLSMAAGIGVDMAYGPANIEFMYNFWHKRTRFDQRNLFQVKFAFGD